MFVVVVFVFAFFVGVVVVVVVSFFVRVTVVVLVAFCCWCCGVCYRGTCQA